MAKWISLKNADGKGGVRYREHKTRKHGAVPDRYYVIAYWWQGKTISEAVGWASEKWTPTKCFDLLAEVKHNQKNGSGPCTLAELRKAWENERENAKKREEAEALSLDDYWPTYYGYAKITKKSNSYDKEESHFRLYLSPTMGKVPLRKIGILQWDLLVETLNKAKLSKRSIEYITGTLRRVLKHAYHRALVDNPPPTGKRIGATGPGSSNRRLRVISHDEADAILTEVKKLDTRAWEITRFAFLTGCRASEAFNLKWRDIDRNRMVLVFPETKNRDNRQIPLTPAIIDLLNELPEGDLDEPVFKKQDGTPHREAPYSFRTAVDNLELNNGRSKRDRVSFHSIRHTVATELAKKLNPRDLMDIMGWRTVQMAMRYVHANENAKTSALAGLHRSMDRKEASAKIIPLVKTK
ncbi:integrase family protein, phage-related [Desulfosarcina variabilis str. Montpellier]|uniref:tyrosine-type recombinase/integrase n=1 Tax=Desulfosarcina variabilis TaxID=2300 RepID=UPI003AFA619D